MLPISRNFEIPNPKRSQNFFLFPMRFWKQKSSEGALERQKKQELNHKESPPTISIQLSCPDRHLFPYKPEYYVFQIVIFSLNYGNCKGKKSIKQIRHRKKKSFLTPKCFQHGMICKFLRQLLQIPPDVRQKQAARGHQCPAGDIPLYPSGRGHRPHSPGEDKWGDTGSALPKHAPLEEKGKKRNPQI